MERESITKEILERVSHGEALRKVVKDVGISSRTFYEWLREDVELEKQYVRACEERAEVKFDSIERDYLEEPQRDPETGKIDSAWVQLQRLKIDAKKWELSKLMPKKYGDKLEVDNKHEGEITITRRIITRE